MTTVPNRPPHDAPRACVVDVLTDGTGPADFELVAGAFLTSYRNGNTRRGYRDALRAWFAWCEGRGMDPLRGVRRPHIEFWARHLEEIDGLALRTIAGRLNALSGYYRTAVMDGWIESTPMSFVRRPRIQRVTSSNDLTGPELMRIIDLASRRRVRDEAMFCILGWNGLRVGELVSLDVTSVRCDKGIYTITFTRKGGNVQTLPLAPRTTQAVLKVIGDRQSGPLFVSLRTQGKRMCRGDVQRMVTRYADWTGVNKRVTPHSFRHTFVTISRNCGIPDREIQRSCGHADPRMVAYYDHGSGNLMTDPTFVLSAHVEGMI